MAELQNKLKKGSTKNNNMKKPFTFLIVAMASLFLLSSCFDTKEREQKLAVKKQLEREKMAKRIEQGHQLIHAVFALSHVQHVILGYQDCHSHECYYTLEDIGTGFNALKDYPDFDAITYQKIDTVIANLNHKTFDDRTYAIALGVIATAKKTIRDKAPAIDLPLDDGLLPSMNILPLDDNHD